MALPRALPFPLSDLQSRVFDWAWFVKFEIASPVGTKRFTDYPNDIAINVDGTVQTWLESGANVGPINQAKSGAATVSWIEMPNMDTLWAQWANIPGLKGTLVTIYVGVWSSASIYDGAYVVAIMEIDEHLVSNWAQLTLVPPRSTNWAKMSLGSPIGALCPYDFTDPNTCQYVGGLANCMKTRDDCVAHANQINFGGQDLLPPPGSVIYNGGVTVV
jgi:hypothetical protein